MRLARRIVFALLALAAVLVLVVESQVDTGDTRIAEGARRLRELDARLDRAVLEAQGGLTLNYDEVGATLREMASVQRDIDQAAAPLEDTVLASRMAAARAHFEEKERLAESYESYNSVFRNSLAFLPAAAKRVTDIADDGAFGAAQRREVEKLLVAVLRCRTECSASTVAEIADSATGIEASMVDLPASDRAPVTALLKHTRVFVAYAGRVDASVRALVRIGGAPYDDVFTTVRERHERALRRANVYRVGLAVLSAALLSAVAVMMRRLGRKAVELASLNQHLEQRVDERTHELSTSREQYRLLLETTQAIPFELEPGSLRFAYVGPQATVVLGYGASELLQDGFFAERVHEEDRAEVVAHLTNAREAEDHQEIEFRLRASDGRWLWLRAFVSTAQDGRGQWLHRGILLDNSTHRALEASLRAAQKLESVGRLASGIAHEINTPVQFVNDNVSFLSGAQSKLTALLEKYRSAYASEELRRAEDEVDLDFIVDNVPKALADSQEGLQRIATIVQAMRGFAHPDQREKQAADINTNIRNTLTIARREYHDVADVVTELGELPLVHCHAGEINQVLLNLIINAAHAIGEIVKETGERGVITVRSRQDEDAVVVSVGDTGSGIPLANREKLFDPFFTTKGVGRGTGQGLAIARSIVVDKHRGELSFESELGRGTEFRVRLPIDGSARRVAA